MELPSDLFQHFTSSHLQLLRDDPSSRQLIGSGKVSLDRQQQQQVESGFLLAQYLLKLHALKPIEKLNSVGLGALKSSHNPTSRLFNWNTVLKEIDKIGIKVDPDSKSLVVSGDHECIIEVLQKVVEAEKRMVENMKLNRSVSKRQKKKEGEQPVDIVSLNPERPLNETESTLEYIIVSLCQALQLQPKQAAGLLTNHNHYLLHACIKGVKSNYEQILNWYQLIYSTSKHLSQLATEAFQMKTFHGEANNQGGYMLMNALKCGFFSESITVTDWTVKVFSKIAQDFDSSNQLEDFYQWFVQMPTQKNGQLGGGLEATLYALNKHSQIVENISTLIYSTFRGMLDRLIPELKDNHFKKNLAQLPQFLCEVLPYLVRQSRDEVLTKLALESGIIEESLRYADPDNKAEPQLRAQSISLIVEIWSLDSELIQDNPATVEDGSSLLDSTVKVLKRGCRDGARHVRLSTLGLMFKLLDQFASVRNNQAPVIYKILTFSMIENIDDEVTREFMMTSFVEVFHNHQSIPVSILIEPLLRVMQVNEKPYSLNTFDFEFFSQVAKHPKLTLSPFGLQLMDQFAKIYLSIPMWAQPASIPLIIIADRFSSDSGVQDFLMKLTSISLTSMLSMKKAWEMVKVKGQPTSKQQPDQNAAADEDDHTKKIRRFNIITITKKILNLKISDEFNEQIKQMILSINRRHKQMYGTMNKGLVHLLEFWFAKGKVAMDDYLKQMDEIEKKQEEDQQKRQAKIARNEEIARIKAKYYHQETERDRSFENASQVSGSQGSPQGRGSQAAMRALVPYIHKEPKTNTERRAMMEIETIKQKREEKAFKQRMEEEKKKLMEEKKKRNLQEELNKRKLELGVAKNLKQENQLVLYESNQETPRAPSQSKPKGSEIDSIKLIDLENEEEEREKDGVKILLNKYQKPFKFLFNKYALSRSQYMKVQSFDYYDDKTINLAEINKMLRDHDVQQSMISKDQLQQLIRLLNGKLYKRLDLSALDFGAFMQLIVQISCFAFSKPPSYLNPTEMVAKLINHFEKATRSRGQSTLLYEDPDVTSIGDQDVLKEMNKRLRDNPEMLIPEGFYKVTEKEQIHNYVLPEYLDIPEEKKIGVEILDEIISKALGFHILEAIVSYEQRIKVKPRIKQASLLIPAANPSLQYMKPIEKKQFTSLNSKSLLVPAQPSNNLQKPTEVFKKPQLGVDLKLALYQLQKDQTSTKDRAHLQETAEVLEEMLIAVDKGLSLLPERERVKFTKDFWNKAKEEKKTKELEEREQERLREEKRQKRKQQLQEEIERQKEEKGKGVEEQKRLLLEREREEKEKQKRLREEQKQKYDERKVIIEEQKKQRIDQAINMKSEEEEKKRQEKQAKAQEQKEFMKKQKEKLEEDFQRKKREKEEAEKAQRELEEWKKEKQSKVKNQMESYIKQNKDQYKAEEREREQINEFFMQPEVQQVFIKFDKALEYLFKFYASQDRKEIGFNLANSLQRVNFNEFIKFGYQCLITPTIVPNDDMVMIFRAMIRERGDKLTQKEIDELGSGVNTLGYEDFKKALIRIAILGQDLLSGQGGMRLEAKLLEKLDQSSASGKPPKIATRSRGRSIIGSSQASKRNILQKQNSTVAISGGGALNDTNLTNQTSKVSGQSTTRKTKEQKKLQDILKEKEKFERQLAVKIEDKRMSKPFDVSIITPHTIEGLLKFIQLQPEDNQYKLDKKLNQQRIEVQGQKPNKLKKSIALAQSLKAGEEDVDFTQKQTSGLDSKLDSQRSRKSIGARRDSDQQAQGGQNEQEDSQLHAVDPDELDQERVEDIIGPEGWREQWGVKNQ